MSYWRRLQTQSQWEKRIEGYALGLITRGSRTVWQPNEQRGSHDSSDKYPAQQHKMAKRKMSRDLAVRIKPIIDSVGGAQENKVRYYNTVKREEYMKQDIWI